MRNLGALELEAAAKQAAGNWRRFRCFVWWRADDLADADNWAVIYTHHRDSGLLDQSNAAVIRKSLEPFTEDGGPDVKFETHSHWAVGYFNGFNIRVFDAAGQITEAFETYHRLAERQEDYPILDEEHYSQLESDAAYENLELAAWSLKRKFVLPDGWRDDVYEWLSVHRETALENTEDQGGWPREEDLEAAFDSLGYARAA